MAERRAIRALIAEDEEPARRTLRTLLEADPDIDVVGEVWGAAALEAVRDARPDLLLLDVRMPGMDGFELLSALAPDELPFVVFVTAYDQYAVDAFEVRAIDYLLKPFTDERLRDALARAKERVRLGERGGAAAALGRSGARVRSESAAHVTLSEPDADRLVLREGSRFLAIPHDEISWIEASGLYVQIHTPDRTHLVRASMKDLARQLGSAGFHRVHRSAIVSLAAVREVRPLSHGDCLVLLADGTKVKLSRSRRDAFEARFFSR